MGAIRQPFYLQRLLDTGSVTHVSQWDFERVGDMDDMARMKIAPAAFLLKQTVKMRVDTTILVLDGVNRSGHGFPRCFLHHSTTGRLALMRVINHNAHF